MPTTTRRPFPTAASPWRRMQMRGLGASYRSFTAHIDDIEEFDARPWWRELLPGGTNFEKWLHRRYGDVIYSHGGYDRTVRR